MDDTSRMEWVARNRAKVERRRPAGDVIGQLIGRTMERSVESVERPAAIVVGIVDEEFRTHCRLGRLSAGTLVITVDHPARASVMKRRWSEPLLAALRSSRACGAVNRIVFEVGDWGTWLPCPAATTE